MLVCFKFCQRNSGKVWQNRLNGTFGDPKQINPEIVYFYIKFYSAGGANAPISRLVKQEQRRRKNERIPVMQRRIILIMSVFTDGSKNGGSSHEGVCVYTS